MTTRSASSSSSSNLFNALVLISIIVAGVFLLSSQSQLRTPRQAKAKLIIPQQQQEESLSFTKKDTDKIILLTMNNKRNMVGGYSAVDSNFLSSDEIMEIANFALNEHANKSQSAADLIEDKTSSFLAVLPEEVANGTVKVKVLEAQRQVVAGLNYKLTIAILKNNICLGGMKGITIYKPLPHMEQGLTITSWGNVLQCNDQVLLQLMEEDVNNKEEHDEFQKKKNALSVEEEIKEDFEKVEPPDA